MIIKNYEINKINVNKNRNFLLYGENQGLKDEIISSTFKKNYQGAIYSYEESDLIKNKENFFSTLLTRSFFDNEKLIIILRATDKVKDIIEEIIEKKIQDLILVINSSALDRKSKLRTLFEKNKELICVPIYDDNKLDDLAKVEKISSLYKDKEVNIKTRKLSQEYSSKAISLIEKLNIKNDNITGLIEICNKLLSRDY